MGQSGGCGRCLRVVERGSGVSEEKKGNENATGASFGSRKELTCGCERLSEVSHGLGSLVPRSVLEDGDMDFGGSEEEGCRENSLEEMARDGFRVEEVDGEVEALGIG